MFIFEAAFQHKKRSGGIHLALKYHADVAGETRLYGPKEGAARREEGSRKQTEKSGMSRMPSRDRASHQCAQYSISMSISSN